MKRNSAHLLKLLPAALAAAMLAAPLAHAQTTARTTGDPVKDQSLRDRQAAGAYAEDSLVTAKVKAALMKDTGLEALDVNVETHRGEVMLAGFVDTDAQKQKAVQIAKSIEGVKTVHDKMMVKKK